MTKKTSLNDHKRLRGYLFIINIQEKNFEQFFFLANSEKLVVELPNDKLNHGLQYCLTWYDYKYKNTHFRPGKWHLLFFANLEKKIQ